MPQFFKPIFIALTIACVCSFSVMAQKNIVKHNFYSYLNFLNGVENYGISYERVVKEKFSWSLTGSYGTFRQDQTSVVSTGTTERLSLQGLEIIPELRWYIFSNEYKLAPLGFFVGSYAKLLFLEENYTRLVSENFDNLASEKGFLGGLGAATGYKLGNDLIALEFLAGLGWGIESGFVDKPKIDPLFARINRKFLLSRLEISVGFMF